MHCFSWPLARVKYDDVLILLSQRRYAEIGPHRVGHETVVVGLERFPKWERSSGAVNGLVAVDIVLGVEYLLLLCVLRVPVEGDRLDPPGGDSAPHHILHGEYLFRTNNRGVVAVLGCSRKTPKCKVVFYIDSYPSVQILACCSYGGGSPRQLTLKNICEELNQTLVSFDILSRCFLKTTTGSGLSGLCWVVRRVIKKHSRT